MFHLQYILKCYISRIVVVVLNCRMCPVLTTVIHSLMPPPLPKHIIEDPVTLPSSQQINNSGTFTGFNEVLNNMPHIC